MKPARFLFPVAALILSVCIGVFDLWDLFMGCPAYAQVSGDPDVNVSRKPGNDSECSIAKNPASTGQLFVVCMTTGAGFFAARSLDNGVSWDLGDSTSKTIANGTPPEIPLAYADPSVAWDSFGNLFLTYLGQDATGVKKIVTLLSTDGGLTFNVPPLIDHPGSVDHPKIVAADTSKAGEPVVVWVVWEESGQMRAQGAAVTGPNQIAFGAVLTIPGAVQCSFGDVAISPTSVVVQACQTPMGGEGPSTIKLNRKTGGLDPGDFDSPVDVTSTNVGGLDFIPAQHTRGITANAGLAYDSFPASPHYGRLYLVYTEETENESNDTDIMLRFSDNDGAWWSNPIKVHEDSTKSQFLPRIAVNPRSGNIAVCWLDARNSVDNKSVEEFCSIATPTDLEPHFLASAPISDGSSTSPLHSGLQFGDYSGLVYMEDVHPIWPDTSNSTGDNPGGIVDPTGFDAYSDRVSAGAAASEGEPHITTINGVHYDFQSAGEFVALRGDGIEIQTRQTPVTTTSIPKENPYIGIPTCVSLNTAVAALVGTHRIRYQPNLRGRPESEGLDLLVDDIVTKLGHNGLDLGSGGRVTQASIGNGIEIDFPNGTRMIVTSGWWASQNKWYLNLNVYHTTATEGIMGILARDSWLPALPDGTSLGAKPTSPHDRYVQLNEHFANKWRVTAATSLFKYATETSTATFTVPQWPFENKACQLPKEQAVKPAGTEYAQKACVHIGGKYRSANCVFDVSVTGETRFAETYRLTEQIEVGSTATTVRGDKSGTREKQSVIFTATVTRKAVKRKGAPSGTVQFILDGAKVDLPVKLDSNGRATWRTDRLTLGKHLISASYVPNKDSEFLPSSSLIITYSVAKN